MTTTNPTKFSTASKLAARYDVGFERSTSDASWATTDTLRGGEADALVADLAAADIEASKTYDTDDRSRAWVYAALDEADSSITDDEFDAAQRDTAARDTATASRSKPATEHVACCYAPNVDGVPSPRMIEIRYDNTTKQGPAYVVTTVHGRVAESSQRRGSREEALQLAANLGYTEVVL